MSIVCLYLNCHNSNCALIEMSASAELDHGLQTAAFALPLLLCDGFFFRLLCHLTFPVRCFGRIGIPDGRSRLPTTARRRFKQWAINGIVRIVTTDYIVRISPYGCRYGHVLVWVRATFSTSPTHYHQSKFIKPCISPHVCVCLCVCVFSNLRRLKSCKE